MPLITTLNLLLVSSCHPPTTTNQLSHSAYSAPPCNSHTNPTPNPQTPTTIGTLPLRIILSPGLRPTPHKQGKNLLPSVSGLSLCAAKPTSCSPATSFSPVFQHNCLHRPCQPPGTASNCFIRQQQLQPQTQLGTSASSSASNVCPASLLSTATNALPDANQTPQSAHVDCSAMAPPNETHWPRRLGYTL